MSVSNYFCKLCVGLFYRPPSSPVSVLDNFYTVLEGLDPSYFSNFVLLGDFNIDFYNPHTPQYCKLTDVMHIFSLMQAVGEATHTTPSGKETQTMNPRLFSNQDFLTILYFNARSLFPKIDELTTLCTLHNPGIVCVVETWLSSDMGDSELSIPNYQVIRLDRNRHGGGVLMYVHNCHTK